MPLQLKLWSATRRGVAATEQKLQVPHGGKLVNLMLAESAKEQAVSSCTKELELSDRNACDVELLCVGCAPVHMYFNKPACTSCMAVAALQQYHTGMHESSSTRNICWECALLSGGRLVRTSGPSHHWRVS